MGMISDRFAKKRKATIGERTHKELRAEALLSLKERGIFVHPSQYPGHSSDKGSVFDGECNHTRCNNRGAVFFNCGTGGYTCAPCARGVNERPLADVGILCWRVEEQLTAEGQQAVKVKNIESQQMLRTVKGHMQ